MLKRVSLLAVVMSACGQQPEQGSLPMNTPKTEEEFYNTALFFDMNSEVERQDCTVKGTLPSWLSGTLLRNGPAKFTAGGKRVQWFDGLAMLHAFEFSPQGVLYSNRFLRSEPFYIMTALNSVNYGGFAQDPCPKAFKDQISQHIPQEMRGIQNADVSIQEYADKMVALTETPLPVVFDPKTVDTVGAFQYQDKIKEGQWESAHPLRDPNTKETFNYFIRFGRKTSYVIWKMKDHEAKREVVAEIEVKYPSYMHSFALTENYVVLAEFPFVVTPIDLEKRKKPFILNYRWEPSRGTTYLVVDRKTGVVQTISGGAPYFAFHHVNAFDKDGKIVMDIVTYPNTDVIEFVTGQKQGENNQVTQLQRFTLDLASKKIAQEAGFDQPDIELPRINDAMRGQEYRFCYGVDYHLPTSIEDSRPLYKVDVQNKSGKSWSEQGCFPGEPIFVPRPDGEGEDDGVVLSVVLDLARKRSFLLILDASTFQELARAEAPNPIPPGLHGLWK